MKKTLEQARIDGDEWAAEMSGEDIMRLLNESKLKDKPIDEALEMLEAVIPDLETKGE